ERSIAVAVQNYDCPDAPLSTRLYSKSCHPIDRISRWRPSPTDGSSSTTAITVSDSRDSRMCFSVFQQSKVEASPRTLIGCGPQPTAVALHDGTADRESHAHAAGFGGVKRLKDLRHPARLQTHPRVRHGGLHLLRVHVPRGDEELPLPLIYNDHRFYGIHQKVQHNLLQLHSITCNGG